MRCFGCEALSLSPLCRRCRTHYLSPKVTRRKVGTLEVLSFFSYEEIEWLLHSKHKPEGWRIYRMLGRALLRPFVQRFIEKIEGAVSIVGVDEDTQSGYAHVACLTHAMKMRRVRPVHAALRASHAVSYSGKPLSYRLSHPRGFRLTNPVKGDVILVDDIITTGTTLHEAYATLKKAGANVLFALTLADASR